MYVFICIYIFTRMCHITSKKYPAITACAVRTVSVVSSCPLLFGNTHVTHTYILEACVCKNIPEHSRTSICPNRWVPQIGRSRLSDEEYPCSAPMLMFSPPGSILFKIVLIYVPCSPNNITATTAYSDATSNNLS